MVKMVHVIYILQKKIIAKKGEESHDKGIYQALRIRLRKNQIKKTEKLRP